MNVLFYRDSHAESAEWLPQLAAGLAQFASVQVITRKEDLISQLMLPALDAGLAVVQVAEQKGLSDLLVFQDVFTKWRLVLVLPDSSPETMSVALRLHPRFIVTPGKPVQWLELVVMQLAAKMASAEDDEATELGAVDKVGETQ